MVDLYTFSFINPPFTVYWCFLFTAPRLLLRIPWFSSIFPFHIHQNISYDLILNGMLLNFLFPAKTPLWGFKVVLTRKLYISITLSHLAAIDQPMLRCTFVVCLRMMSLQNIWVVTIFHWVCLRIYIIVINIKVFYLLGVKLTSWNPYILKYHIIQFMNMHGQITWAQSNKVARSYLVNLMRSSESRHDNSSQVTNHKYTKGSCSIYRGSNVGIITANGFLQLSRPAKTIGESRNKSVGKF